MVPRYLWSSDAKKEMDSMLKESFSPDEQSVAKIMEEREVIRKQINKVPTIFLVDLSVSECTWITYHVTGYSRM